MGRLLDINSVIIHKYSSILSAYGMDLAEVTDEQQAPASEIYSEATLSRLQARAAGLREKVARNLQDQGIPETLIETVLFLSMRFQGTDTNLMIEEPFDGDFATVFKHEFKREFTHLPDNRDILIDGIRVRGKSKSQILGNLTPFEEMTAVRERALEQHQPEPVKTSRVYFKDLGWTETPVYILDRLVMGARIPVSVRMRQCALII
jgi:5-oxoprolinase (ATP-hydrolysing)